jgi:lipopolysaccharide/colanic/teichoic acid biosynthesis glycosyltransferase
MKNINKVLKRFADIVFSFLGLLFSLPFIFFCSIIIKIEDKGPAFFKQERIGKGGKPFLIYKFRTMIVNTEENNIPQLAEANDERLTSFGCFLRKHHLDEMPQLWNVLKGDMSFVGYRPERKYFIEKIMAVRPDYERLYEIRPGITSLATIYNGYTYTLEKMIRRLDMDLDYLEHHSFLGDMRIIAQTFIYVILGKKF